MEDHQGEDMGDHQEEDMEEVDIMIHIMAVGMGGIDYNYG